MHLNRKRDKPLRTYGKRSSTATTDGRGEPPTKRQKSDHTATTQSREDKENEAPNAVSVTKQAQKPVVSTGSEEKASKGSILSYFKKATPKSTGPSIVDPEDSRVTSNDAPTSPQQIRTSRRKAPRLLRVGRASCNEKGRCGNGESPEQREERNSSTKQEDTPQTGQDDEDEQLPTESRRNSNTRQSAKMPSAPISKPKAQPTVQTTLNITSQAPFSECKTCDTVWNPLYPDDVKYHTKRHRAVVALRKKKSKLS